ncbi:hypothetical protein Bbelb_329050 [Branchiostoma belcheri]|nr:hypothetical protein Bbelb_329050 [Branchiostoma belcheri]
MIDRSADDINKKNMERTPLAPSPWYGGQESSGWSENTKVDGVRGGVCAAVCRSAASPGHFNGRSSLLRGLGDPIASRAGFRTELTDNPPWMAEPRGGIGSTFRGDEKTSKWEYTGEKLKAYNKARRAK